MKDHWQIEACDASILTDRHATNARPLTHDEQKAAEAAFRQQPFNPVWSQAALAVYAGITTAMTKSTSGPSGLPFAPGFTVTTH